MGIKSPMKYVQPFTEGLSRLLQNSSGDYGPTLAISHFLPVYIPSLHDSDFGSGFSTLFNSDYDIAVSGVKGEPIWLPDQTVRYEYRAVDVNKITALVKSADVPVSAAVSSSGTYQIYENVIVSGTNQYSLSKVSGGISGVNGWLFNVVNIFLIGVPLFTVAPILFGYLPTLFRRVLTFVKTAELFVFINIHPEFYYLCARPGRARAGAPANRHARAIRTGCRPLQDGHAP
jgi:hypothetical protein